MKKIFQIFDKQNLKNIKICNSYIDRNNKRAFRINRMFKMF